ncbi:MAG: ribosome maturation factor RimM [Muribaculaceae bacterium]
MITREELIEIGIFNKPHGVKGEISATIDCEPDNFARFSCLVVDVNGIFVPFFCNEMRTKSVDSVLLTIDGIDSDKDVKLLVNKTIYVLKKEYNELSNSQDCDQLPIDYFIGFVVKDEQGEELGEIVDIDDTTQNVLFIIESTDNEEFSIPAVEDLIIDIDEDNKVMVMSLPEGILDI